jgi:hypothetical protein
MGVKPQLLETLTWKPSPGHQLDAELESGFLMGTKILFTAAKI